MKFLPALSDTAEDVYTNCISKVRNQTLKTNLTNCLYDIINSSLDFYEKRKNNELYNITSIPNISAHVSGDEMRKVYKTRMVGSKSPGRYFYDKVRAMSTNNICPFCGIRIVKTVDHYLPKSLYPIFSVIPINLLPSCSDCNKLKDDYFPRCHEKELLHPFFDNLTTEIWLKCEVLSPYLKYEFYVDSPSSWNRQLSNRVENHLKVLKLKELFALQCASEYSGSLLYFKNTFNKKGQQGLMEYLLEMYESNENDLKNHWKTAFYMGLYNNSDFCEGKLF